MEEFKKTEKIPKNTEAHKKNLENWEAKTEEERNGFEVAKILQTKGLAYFAGGYVRDLLLNREFKENFSSKDIDIATDLPPEEVVNLLKKNGFRAKLVGESFGVVKAYREGEENEAV